MSGDERGHGEEPRAGDLPSSAVAFLRAVSAGDDRAVDLAARLAECLLNESGARLALSVLEGGPLSLTRAIRLAEHVLKGANRATGGGIAAGGAS